MTKLVENGQLVLVGVFMFIILYFILLLHIFYSAVINVWALFRWTLEVQKLQNDKAEMIGNCLLSAAFLSYTAVFSWEYRVNMVYNDWYQYVKELGIPSSESYRIEKELTTDVQISK